MSKPRMRTAEGVLEEIKRQDPSSVITLHFIRKLIKSGKISVVNAGCRKFVDVDLVLDFLARGESMEQPDIRYGEIRRVM